MLLNIGAIQKQSQYTYNYDCTSLTKHNGYPTTCQDLAQYAVHVLSTRAQCDKLPGF